MGKFIGFTKNGISKALTFCTALSFAVLAPALAFANDALVSGIETKVEAIVGNITALGLVVVGITLAIITVSVLIRLIKKG